MNVPDSRTYDFLETPRIVHFDDAQVGSYLDLLMRRFVEEAGRQDPLPFSLAPDDSEEFRLAVGHEVVAAGPSRKEGTMRLLIELKRTTVRHLRSMSVHCGAVAGPPRSGALPCEDRFGQVDLDG